MTKKEFHRSLFNMFFTGVFAHAAMNILIQDWLGLEGYIVFVQENWIHLHWGVGATLLGISIYFYFLLRNHITRKVEESWGKL